MFTQLLYYTAFAQRSLYLPCPNFPDLYTECVTYLENQLR